MNKETEAIIRLGKDAVVQLALDIVDDSASIQNFAKIKVTTNGNEVYVYFSNPITYLPIETIFYTDVIVSIFGKTTVYSPISNGIDDTNNKNIPFYKETNETKLNTQFVLKAINKSTEVGSIDITDFEDTMIIREYKNHYAIEIVSEVQESSYTIEKISGNLSNVMHAHLVPPPLGSESMEVFREID
ncbi:hypothetical protein [Aquimarina intermedia]|nr:hypothetical protein [Aquimarina intermedia]